MSIMKHLILVRHGESELNVVNRQRRVFCGQFETPLTQRGRQQALEAAQRLMELDYLSLQVAISSPLERARETLQLRLSRLPAEIKLLPPSPGLMERSHGVFEGKPEDEAFQEQPAYRDDPEFNCFMDPPARTRGRKPGGRYGPRVVGGSGARRVSQRRRRHPIALQPHPLRCR
jgi:broad specificity phosphatase PhoE